MNFTSIKPSVLQKLQRTQFSPVLSLDSQFLILVRTWFRIVNERNSQFLTEVFWIDCQLLKAKYTIETQIAYWTSKGFVPKGAHMASTFHGINFPRTTFYVHQPPNVQKSISLNIFIDFLLIYLSLNLCVGYIYKLWYASKFFKM